MTIITIVVADLVNPIEVQEWLTANQDVVISKLFVQQNIFYVVYQ